MNIIREAVSPITTHGRRHVNHGKSSEIRGETIQRDDKRGGRDTTARVCARVCQTGAKALSSPLPSSPPSRERRFNKSEVGR